MYSVSTFPAGIDLLLRNGKVWTCDPHLPLAEAVAVQGHRIVAVGSNAELEPFAEQAERVIDLQGRLLLPGFNDAHVHFYIGGDTLASVNLREVKSPQELRETLRQYVQTRAPGEWILNGSWDHERWDPVQLPTAALIDAVTPDHPVWINRSDGHMKLANSLAMRLAGVDRNTPDVPGGEIVRDDAGNPTGIFKDAANRLVDHAIPLPSKAHMRSALLAAQQYALENGVTSVQDMGVLGSRGAETMAEVIRTYQELDLAGEWHVRVSAHLPLPEWQRLGHAGIRARMNTGRLQLGGVKSFSDGSLGSTTAWFFEPYTDAPHTCGLPSEEMLDGEAMYARMRAADAAGLQLVIHAIGDRANSAVLDLCERLQKENGPLDRRLRIEHAQHLRREDIARFAELGVIASVQPYHALDDGRWAERRIGPERVKNTYAFRSLLDAGATVAFGSDWWVAPISPLWGIFAAVTRRTLDGQFPDGWVPEEKVTVEEAVHAYTVAAAYASGEEEIKGSITPGKLADLVILSGDIFLIDPVRIPEVTVDATISDGQFVYERRSDKTPTSPN
ncbi:MULTISPECIES: amidohydrolase [Acidobacterium]|uniref:Amidohydrolase family protein n=1 Tax=Acidobacterium capsulatum (strain ATCC 51196 / DSM 11244 / BCRC 80197 / JCM 7670 / NBRC 15755 / NCIMB 13165 / 161) TaxID=240015 RepID=C1F7G0_ACIC5|nr:MULTISPECIES: amidohydrolase [Acidobacterium]ACO31513.1 amidohydrolase family protein [Acidobacterium capsulatum ATCC 51196]